MNYRCTGCGRVYEIKTYRYSCECGGLFALDYKKDTSAEFSDSWSLWRYQGVLPPFRKELIDTLSLGEGMTPLVHLSQRLYGKGDYYMPTLSFKDRGAVMLVAHMKSIGVKRCAIDSSGNGATAVAAYCARADIYCDVFVPSHTSRKKVAQIEAYGANIHLIEGPREASGEAVKRFVEEEGVFYASHIYNPFFFEGTKTYLYELYEQMKGKLPDILIIPVGNGTLLTGAAIALREMLSRKMITSVPRIIAVQAEACAPLSRAFYHTSFPAAWEQTLAEGIAIAEPARKELLLSILSEFSGEVIEVSEEEIQKSHKSLSRQGVFVEHTSAANHAGYEKLLRSDPSVQELDTVIPLCGAGLKSLHS